MTDLTYIYILLLTIGSILAWWAFLAMHPGASEDWDMWKGMK